MKFSLLLLFLAAADGPRYTAEGKLQYPPDYREWVFLSSGVGMTYEPAAAAARQSAPQFDNVFVNPSSYRAFLKSGAWPKGTAFMLELRKSQSHGSINNDGHFQVGLSGIEAEVKDEKDEWKFYSYPMENGRVAGPGKIIPGDASCYSCHAKNAAVENTFVQFYPEMMAVAEKMGTVRKDFVH